MNPQHRPLTQELVQMAMAKTAERVALLEESDRQRGLPPTAKVASGETDESIGTDFAEKLASAVEFILPEVQAKEAGALDSVGRAIRGRAFDSAMGKGVGSGVARKVVTGIGNLTDKQVGGRVLAAGGGLLAAGAGGAAALHHRNKEAAKLPEALVANAKKVKGAFEAAGAKGKEKVMSAASSFKKNVGSEGGKKIDKLKDMRTSFPRQGKDVGPGSQHAARDVLESEITKQRVKTHGGRAAVAGGAAAAVGGVAHAAHKKEAAISGRRIGEAKAVAAKALEGKMPAHLQPSHVGVIKQKAMNAANSFKDAFKGDKLKDLQETKAIADQTTKSRQTGKALDTMIRREKAKTYGARGAAGAAAAGAAGGAALAGKKIHDKATEKKAEDAINPAHISGKASPLAAAPTRTEAGQPGPSAQGNTGALSSNAAAIAFSNAKNQGMKAEQLRKYFSNPASSQHGDPALGKNFAHKTASDKVAEAQHILSALAAQVEGK